MALKMFSHRYVTLSWDFLLDHCTGCDLEIGDQLFMRGPRDTAENMRHFCATWAENKRRGTARIPQAFSHFERRLDTDAAVSWETFTSAEAGKKNIPVSKVPIPPILFEHLPAFAFTTVERILELDRDFEEVERQINRERKKRGMRVA